MGFPGPAKWALSDQNGVFTITEFEAGPYRFVVLHRGYYYADQNVNLTGPMDFRVEMTPEDISAPVGSGSWAKCSIKNPVDGIRAPGFDLNSMPPDAVEALEVYQGVNVPVEYSNSCGVVLIWMRRAGGEEYRNRSRDSQEVNSEVKL